MTLQTSGQISLDDIGDEFEVAAANRSLVTSIYRRGVYCTARHQRILRIQRHHTSQRYRLLLGFSPAAPPQPDSYDINTVSTSGTGNPTLRICLQHEYREQATTAHTVGIFKNGTNMNYFNSATSYTNGVYWYI